MPRFPLSIGPSSKLRRHFTLLQVGHMLQCFQKVFESKFPQAAGVSVEEEHEFEMFLEIKVSCTGAKKLFRRRTTW